MLYPLLNLGGQAPAPSQPAAPALRPRRRHTVWVKPWIQQRDDMGTYTTPEFFEMLQESP